MNFTPAHIDRENDRLRKGLFISTSPFDGHALHLESHKPELVAALNAKDYDLATRIRLHMAFHRSMLKPFGAIGA